jgi:hypothetical protein
MFYKILPRKLKIEQHVHHLKPGVNSDVPEGYTFCTLFSSLKNFEDTK